MPWSKRVKSTQGQSNDQRKEIERNGKFFLAHKVEQNFLRGSFCQFRDDLFSGFGDNIFFLTEGQGGRAAVPCGEQG